MELRQHGDLEETGKKKCKAEISKILIYCGTRLRSMRNRPW
jgi:hypothetical protein